MNRAFVHAKGQLAPLQAFQFAQGLFSLRRANNQALGVILQKSSCVRQPNRPGAAHKKLLPKVIFELPNRQANRGLRAVEPFGGTGKTAFTRDR